jgi:protein gp37
MSKIEWTERTWNPIAGCSVVSPGCTNCYAMRQAHRLAANPSTPHYAGTTAMTRGGPVWTGKIGVAGDSAFLAPLRRKKPQTYFVNSMSDLFHEEVPDEVIDRVFAVMALCPQHTFQVLTKRAKRMRSYILGLECDGARRFNIAGAAGRMMERGDDAHDTVAAGPWPLPNVWVGISAEDQRRADERVPELLATPAAVRFVSAEPLLGPLDLTRICYGGNGVWQRCVNALSVRGTRSATYWEGDEETPEPPDRKLDWIIVGGESGPDARPTNPQWFRNLRDQCVGAGVPFFFKQWGAWASVSEVEGEGQHFTYPDGRTVRRIGKRAAGRVLDGRTWDEVPA